MTAVASGAPSKEVMGSGSGPPSTISRRLRFDQSAIRIGLGVEASVLQRGQEIHNKMGVGDEASLPQRSVDEEPSRFERNGKDLGRQNRRHCTTSSICLRDYTALITLDRSRTSCRLGLDW